MKSFIACLVLFLLTVANAMVAEEKAKPDSSAWVPQLTWKAAANVKTVVEAIAVSPNGKWVAVSSSWQSTDKNLISDGMVEIFASGQTKPTHRLPIPTGVRGHFSALGFSPDSSLLYGNPTLGPVVVWDLAEGKCLGSFEEPVKPFGAHYKGCFAVNPKLDNPVFPLSEPGSPEFKEPPDVSFPPFMVMDGRGRTVHVLDQKGRLIGSPKLGWGFSTYRLAFAADGQAVLAVGGEVSDDFRKPRVAVLTWSFQSQSRSWDFGFQEIKLPANSCSMTVSSQYGGVVIATCGGGLCLMDLQQLKPQTFRSPKLARIGKYAGEVVYLADGTTVAAAVDRVPNRKTLFEIWDTRAKPPKKTAEFESVPGNAMAPGPNNTLYVGDVSGRVTIFAAPGATVAAAGGGEKD